MWVKECHQPPMTGNGLYHQQKHADLGDGANDIALTYNCTRLSPAESQYRSMIFLQSGATPESVSFEFRGPTYLRRGLVCVYIGIEW